MNYTYVSVDRIFSKLVRDVTNDFSEGDIIEWCGEALEFIGATRLYEEAVAFIEVNNHQCKVPAGNHMVMQIARDNRWTEKNEDPFCPAKIVTEVSQDPQAAIPVIIDCHGQPVTDYELAYYR